MPISKVRRCMVKDTAFTSHRRMALIPTIRTLILSVGLVGCHDLAGNQALPAGTQDPSYYANATGALGMRNTAVFTFGNALPTYIITTGLLADELTDLSSLNASVGTQLANGGAVNNPLDERILPELPYGVSGSYASDVTYNRLQEARAVLLQAIGQLATYDTSAKDTAILKPAVGKVLRGELYALYGYTEIMLADFFCSGIPLSTLDFEHDFTYRAGSPRNSVYRDAIAKLDTALTLSMDSVRIQNLVRVGLGRAYLDLGLAAAAADDVSGVPSDYRYQLSESWGTGATGCSAICNLINQSGTVSDEEGGNGLPYTSSGDPRTADTVFSYSTGTASYNGVGFPKLYKSGLGGATVPITVASGVEARLIQAEAALRTGDVTTWLDALNQLRTDGTGATIQDTVADTLGVTDCLSVCGYDPGNGLGGSTPEFGQPAGGFPVPAGYTFAFADTTYPAPAGIQNYCYNWSWYVPCYQGDSMVVYVYVGPVRTAWHAGTGGVSGLAPLSDPGTDSARVALLFRERAAWLYMTGHRQGDLRRQLQQYPQYWPNQRYVYPAGAYPGLGAGFYGTDVTAPIPANEYLNPLFHGCLNRAP